LTEFKVPELGENVEAADVSRVLVNVGDTIKREQPVLELETDKATIEVPSSVAGVIKEIKVKKGEKVKVGAVVLTVDDAGTNGAGKAAAPAAAAEAPAAAPEPPKDAKEAPAKEAPGKEAPAASAAAPKEDHKVISMPQRPATSAGRPEPVEGRPAAVETRPQVEPAVTAPAPSAPRGPAAPAAPSVRRLAREIGVDINQVQGGGPGGRISLDDVKEHARRILSSVGSAGATGVARSSGDEAEAAGSMLIAVPLRIAHHCRAKK